MKNLNSYLDRLTSMRMRPEVLQHAVDILKAVPQIQTELENPATSRMKREDIIQEIFPTESRQFIYGLVEDGALGSLDEILKAYMELSDEERTPLSCVLEYVTEPDDAQYEGIIKFLRQQYPERVLNISRKQSLAVDLSSMPATKSMTGVLPDVRRLCSRNCSLWIFPVMARW